VAQKRDYIIIRESYARFFHGGRHSARTAGGLFEDCALLVPKEMKLEHTNSVSSLSDEELDQAIAAIKAMLAAQADEPANVIEGTAEPVALPAPEAQSEPTPAPKLPRNRTA
jgi:hypothetical protein